METYAWAALVILILIAFRVRAAGNKKVSRQNDEGELSQSRVDTKPILKPKQEPRNPAQKSAPEKTDFVSEPKNALIQISPTPKPEEVVLTRTTSIKTGKTAAELWAGERTWSPQESHELIQAYSAGLSPRAIAVRFSWDKKDVICRLTRAYFDFSGNLEDEENAINNRLRWTDEEHQELLTALEAGEGLDSMISRFGRTGLAIGWRLLDSHLIKFDR